MSSSLSVFHFHVFPYFTIKIMLFIRYSSYLLPSFWLVKLFALSFENFIPTFTFIDLINLSYVSRFVHPSEQIFGIYFPISSSPTDNIFSINFYHRDFITTISKGKCFHFKIEDVVEKIVEHRIGPIGRLNFDSVLTPRPTSFHSNLLSTVMQ